MNTATTARQTLNLLLPEWQALLKSWAINGQLVVAAHEALEVLSTEHSAKHLLSCNSAVESSISDGTSVVRRHWFLIASSPAARVNYCHYRHRHCANLCRDSTDHKQDLMRNNSGRDPCYTDRLTESHSLDILLARNDDATALKSSDKLHTSHSSIELSASNSLDCQTYDLNSGTINTHTCHGN